jgi:hypothetical protein
VVGQLAGGVVAPDQHVVLPGGPGAAVTVDVGLASSWLA